MESSEKHHFFSMGMQYYVAGRYSAVSGLIPVAGNLFHHAIEMLLKGFLWDHMSLGDLKKSIGHKLETAWQEFKVKIGDISLDRFDRLIERLHEFERIRYPDDILKFGMQCSIGFGTFQSVDCSSECYSEPLYELSVTEIDDLVNEIFQRSSLNIKAYSASLLNSDAKTFLRLENRIQFE